LLFGSLAKFDVTNQGESWILIRPHKVSIAKLLNILILIQNNLNYIEKIQFACVVFKSKFTYENICFNMDFNFINTYKHPFKNFHFISLKTLTLCNWTSDARTVPELHDSQFLHMASLCRILQNKFRPVTFV
jgi:hypothetical protein